MYDRRDFFKTTTAAAASILVASSAIPAFATDAAMFTNIVYTKENPGKWGTKVWSHAPQVSVKGSTVVVTTRHSMSNAHFIVRHTLVLGDGTFLGATTFSPADKPESSYELPAGYKGKIFATSFCNKHDFWLTETIV